MCLKCKSGKCCPKYCISCSGSTKCDNCQHGFKIQKGFLNWAFCVNSNPEEDPNRDKIDPLKCR